MPLPSETTRYDTIIVGAGAVGLFLGFCLHRLGIRFTIVERRKERRPGPRMVVLYPHVLELCDKLGLTDPLMARGMKLSKALAFKGRKSAGEVRFSDLPPPHSHALVISQFEIERLLEDRLLAEVPYALRRGTLVEKVSQLEKGIELEVRGNAAMLDRITGLFAVGTDAKRSAFREKAQIGFEEAGPSDYFVTGDYEDTTGLGATATLCLDAEGFIESFPLPGGARRWVVQTEHLEAEPSEPKFVDAIKRRAGVDVAGGLVSLLSAFSVEHYCARSFVQGRAMLCGEAAHVVYSLGGIGLNTAWLGAWDAAGAIQRAIRDKAEPRDKLDVFERSAHARAHAAIKRMEFFTSLGRPGGNAIQRTLALALLSRGPFSDMATRYYTVSAK